MPVKSIVSPPSSTGNSVDLTSSGTSWATVSLPFILCGKWLVRGRGLLGQRPLAPQEESDKSADDGRSLQARTPNVGSPDSSTRHVAHRLVPSKTQVLPHYCWRTVVRHQWESKGRNSLHERDRVDRAHQTAIGFFFTWQSWPNTLSHHFVHRSLP